MPDQTQGLVDDLASVCLTARDRGLRYDDILAALRVVDGRVRIAARYKKPDIDRLEQIQPPMRNDEWQRKARRDAPRTGVQPMSGLVRQAMASVPMPKNKSPAQKAG